MKKMKEKQTADYYFKSGQSKGSSGDYEGAIKDYTKAIKLNLKDNSVYFERGLARHFLAEKYKKGAFSDLKKAIKLDPRDTDSKRLLDAFYKKSKK